MPTISRKTRRVVLTAVLAVTMLVAFASLGGVSVATSAIGAAQYQYGKKVTICHKGKVTISIAVAAWPAHLRHGDTEGACPEGAQPAKAKKVKAKNVKAAKAVEQRRTAKAAETKTTTKSKQAGNAAGKVDRSESTAEPSSPKSGETQGKGPKAKEGPSAGTRGGQPASQKPKNEKGQKARPTPASPPAGGPPASSPGNGGGQGGPGNGSGNGAGPGRGNGNGNGRN